MGRHPLIHRKDMLVLNWQRALIPYESLINLLPVFSQVATYTMEKLWYYRR